MFIVPKLGREIGLHPCPQL